MLETFLVESWMEHLRQHERVTKADRVVQEAVERFDFAGDPKVTHFIAAESVRLRKAANASLWRLASQPEFSSVIRYLGFVEQKVR